jgi:transcription termination/antitermination protein NusG
MAWYVLRTNIKSEDKAERNLAAAGFRTYAPWQKFERLNRRKRIWVQHEMRLAPRYLFLETPSVDVPWYVIRACEGVESVLGVEGRPIRLNGVQTKQLTAIMAAEADFAFDETRAGKLHRREIGKTKKETTRMKFPVGSKVRISDGPFSSFNGEITNVNGRGHLLVMTEIFGRMTPVELEVGQVEAIASAA